MRIIVPATGTLVGTTVGAITYLTLSETGNAAAAVTGTGTRIISFLSGKGVEYFAGPLAGRSTELALQEIGANYLTPAVRKSGQVTAYITAAALGLAATAITSMFIVGGNYLYDRITKRVPQQQMECASYNMQETGDFQVITLYPSVKQTGH